MDRQRSPLPSTDPMQNAQTDTTICDGLEPKRFDNILAPMAQPSEAGRSRLESLPNELLMAICEGLVYEDHLQFFSRRSAVPSGYYDLCLVSKRICLIAQPCMYKKISVSDFQCLARLCRTIAGDQMLGDAISEMRINVDFHEIRVKGDIGKLLTPDEAEEVFDDCYQVIGRGERQYYRSEYWEGELIGILCYELLARTVSLRSMTMVYNSYEDLDYNPYKEDKNRQIYSAFLDRVTSTNRPDANGSVTAFLPRLESLALESRHGRIPPEVFKHFIGLPSLREIESIRPGGYWNNSLPNGGQWAKQGIGKLYLSWSWMCERDLDDMAQLFPTLEVLSVHIGIPYSFQNIPLGSGFHRRFSAGFSGMTSLRTLKISVDPSFLFAGQFYNYTIQPGTVFPGPNMVLDLTCLSNLRELELPSFSVAHLAPSGSGESMVAPSKILPQTLERLVLVAQRHCYHPDGSDCWDSMPAALGFLESLGRDLSSFERLKSVAHCFHPISCANPLRSQEDEEAEDSERSEAYESSDSSQGSQSDPVEDSPENNTRLRVLAVQDSQSDPVEDSPGNNTRLRVLAVQDLYSMNSVEFCLQRMTRELGRVVFDLDQWK